MTLNKYHRWFGSLLLVVALWLFICPLTGAQSHGPAKGTLILTGGDQETALKEFVTLAGGPDANIVYIPTAATSIRLPSGLIWEWLYTDELPANTPAFKAELCKMFGIKAITILHTRNRKTANSGEFVKPLRSAQGVWISGGNAGRLAQAYLDTLTQRELEAVLSRGGVVAGNSGGAIIQGSYTIRGNPDKPILMAKGSERGFGFLRNVAINPHLSESMRQNELVTIIDTYPKLLGIGIDEKAAILVTGDRFKVIGKGRVAIYDNTKHGSNWYYWLENGDVFNLRTRSKENLATDNPDKNPD
ncbi:MAG TPA: cyanophycinase [Pyrinomonadaceae bacterium]|nr:cyanophycinase [Pyrinomonadaceae bacterium]